VLVWVALGGCGGAKPLEFPRQLEGGWQLAGVSTQAEAPEQARQLGVKQVQVGRYRGAGELVVTVYTMGGQAAAFELVQKWRAAPGTMFFQVEQHFVVVELAGAEQLQLSALARQLEAALSGRQGGQR
jgi:hypothetical protein